MRLLLVIGLLVSTVVSGSIVPESHNRVRRQLYGKQPTPLPPLDGYTRQGVPVVISSYADSKRVDTSFDGRKELDHYRDFVNDPWVNTEDLGQIVQSRPRPELRSGRGSVDDEIWTRRRQHQQHYQQQQHQPQPQPQRIHSPLPTSSSWSRVPEPWYRRAGENPRVRARTQTRDPADTANALSRQGHPTQSQTRSLTNTNQHLEGGDAWWEVASRGDDHITYRRRDKSHRPYDVQRQHNYQTNTYNARRNEEAAPLRQMGEGEGQVLARVVDLRSGTEQLVRDNQRRNSYSSSSSAAGGGRVSYQPTRTYQTDSRHTQPELRSLDSTSSQGQNEGRVREGNWVRASSSDSHVTWRKVGTESGSSGRVYHQGPQAYGHASRSRESWTVRPVTRYDTNYPIMNDRETADKAERNGPNVMVKNH